MAGEVFVKAKEMGFYRGQRRRAGTVFKLEDPKKDFKPSWMVEAKSEEATDTPESRAQAEREHKATMRGRPHKRLQPNGVDPMPESSVDPTESTAEKATGDKSVL